jgi:pimeloyl-ACP methyl ester carboxylesterase
MAHGDFGIVTERTYTRVSGRPADSGKVLYFANLVKWRIMNLLQFHAVATVLFLWAGGAAAETVPAPEPAPDKSLAIYARPQQLVELRDGRRIHLLCMGEGSPTVILTAGLGDWVAIWSKVQASVALKTRACGWDRAGFGYSDPSSAPQDANHTTSDLEEALRKAKINGPYILVGHSFGGYESLLFADRHHRQVLAMVLVDPSFPDQDHRVELVAPKLAALLRNYDDLAIAHLKKCAAELRSGALKIGSPDPDKCFDYPLDYPVELKEALIRVDSNPTRLMTQVSLIEQAAHSSAIVVNHKRNYGEIPLRILTSSKLPDLPSNTPADAIAEWPTFALEWGRAHDAMAALSTRGVNSAVQGSSHYIQELKPEIVISAVNAVIDEGR